VEDRQSFAGLEPEHRDQPRGQRTSSGRFGRIGSGTLRKVYIILLCKSESEGNRAGAGLALFARSVTDRSCLIIRIIRRAERSGLTQCAATGVPNLPGDVLCGGWAYKIRRAVLAGGGACHAFWQAKTREDRPYIASI
jgi:hypothetical protein